MLRTFPVLALLGCLVGCAARAPGTAALYLVPEIEAARPIGNDITTTVQDYTYMGLGAEVPAHDGATVLLHVAVGHFPDYRIEGTDPVYVSRIHQTSWKAGAGVRIPIGTAK